MLADTPFRALREGQGSASGYLPVWPNRHVAFVIARSPSARCELPRWIPRRSSSWCGIQGDSAALIRGQARPRLVVEFALERLLVSRSELRKPVAEDGARRLRLLCEPDRRLTVYRSHPAGGQDRPRRGTAPPRLLLAMRCFAKQSPAEQDRNHWNQVRDRCHAAGASFAATQTSTSRSQVPSGRRRGRSPSRSR